MKLLYSMSKVLPQGSQEKIVVVVQCGLLIWKTVYPVLEL